MGVISDQPEVSDGELILKMRQGDMSALAEIFERYKERIYRTALAITRDPAAAEDILQESFVRLFSHADRLRTDTPVGPWLYRVAVNLSADWLSHRRRWFEVLQHLIERWTAPIRVERAVEERELQEKVHRAIRSLPVAQQVVIVLHYLEGMSLKEIAEILEIPEGTVKSRLYHAREALRMQLTELRPSVEMVYELT